jgi:hypothetical protein
MQSYSLLFQDNYSVSIDKGKAPPDFRVDLNMDQVIDSIAAYTREYDLHPIFYSPLNNAADVEHRQAIFRDLEAPLLLKLVKSFTQNLYQMHMCFSAGENNAYPIHKQGWFLEAAAVYCQAVSSFAEGLARLQMDSTAFLRFREYISAYVRAEEFTNLVAEICQVKADLSAITYSLIIQGPWVGIRPFKDEPDYMEEVQRVFEKFKDGAVKNYMVDFPPTSGTNHVEAHILDFVALLFPLQFQRLTSFCLKYKDFIDEKVKDFDREIQFFLAYLDYIATIDKAGLGFCYPRVTAQSKEIFAKETYDLALASKRVAEHATVVCNDFFLRDTERIFVISGPNQGGKTTFARTFGQLHYLASLGCPVPGREAQLFLYDLLFTHFENEEDITNLRGKLQDDVFRIHQILEQATPNSILILNEIFTSTTYQDAVFMSKKSWERSSPLIYCVFG